MAQSVDPAQSFPELEERVLERWRERDVFHESVRRREAEGAPEYVFYEGPPTANGRPGSHHVLARAFKDVFPRYRAMRGYVCHRKGGWDCHGLPVEIQVERELGIQSKEDVENFGIAEFNAKCRESVFTYIEEWNRLTERIGFWVDLDDAYATLDNDYIESVWWGLKEVWKQDLLYQGHKVVPYCPRCGTALSSHEVAMGYKDVVDPSVYVRFPVKGQPGVSLLGWTTTPWTLLSNAALAVGPDVEYVRARLGEETFIVAAALAVRVLGEGAEVVDTMKGSDLEGTAYEPPFPYVTDFGPHSHTVLAGDFVTTEDGTGIVHTALAFGEDDYRLGQQYGMTVQNPVKLDGTFDERIEPFAGRFVKDADPDIIEALRESGRLFRAEDYEHSYPHCWRCDTPLLYYAKESWYVRTTARRDDLLRENENTDWHPDHIKHGRMGEWLRGNVDWALSRERYWGTPLPVWRCAGDEEHWLTVGSRDEIRELGGEPPDDLHKPFIDAVVLTCPDCGGEMRRVPEVIDVWWDSGSMPFAQWHAPFENEERFEQRFPADYICEGLDQTRGWFYSLLAVNTLVFGRNAFKTVLCLGLILDPDGYKMSKSRDNIVVPWDVIDKHGADAFRWYYFTSKQPWDGYRFSVDTVGESVRLFMRTLWNTVAFYDLYSEDRIELDPDSLQDVDRWLLSRLQAVTETAIERMDDYDTTAAGRAMAQFVDDLSNWYVRLNRRRFWNEDSAAFATLRHCLVEISKLLAPLVPFISDEIYERLDGSEPSVHLADYPEPNPGLRDEQLEWQMGIAREVVELGRAARAQGKVKLRQPLPEAVVVAAERERDAIERFRSLVLEELNVKELRFVSEADELGRWELKANYRTLGPRFGKEMPMVAEAIAALDAERAADTLRSGGRVGINLNGHEHELDPGDVQLVLQPLEGYQVERAGTHAVALNLEITDELKREGMVREIVRAVQDQRKTSGLNVEDRISLTLGGDEELLDAVRAHEEYLTGEVLATSISYEGDGAPTKIEGRDLAIGVERAG